MSLWGLLLYRLKGLAASRTRLLLMLVVPCASVWAVAALAVPTHPRIPVALVDEDQTDYSAAVAARFARRPVLEVTAVPTAEAARLVETGRVEAAVLLEAGFKERILRGDTDGLVRVLRAPASLSSDLVGEYVASEVTRLVSNGMAADLVVGEYERRGRLPPGGKAILWQEVWAYADEHWRQEPMVPLEFRESPAGAGLGASEQSAARSQAGVVYGLLASLVLFNSLLSAGWIVEDRNSGLFRRLTTTATRPARYLAGNALAMTLVGAVTAACTLALFGYGLHWRLPGGADDLALAAGYLAAVTGVAVLVSACLKTEFQLQVVAPFLTLMTGAVGAGMSSLADLGARLKALSLLTPQGWLLDGLARSAAGTSVALPLLVLVASGLAAGLVGWLLVAHQSGG